MSLYNALATGVEEHLSAAMVDAAGRDPQGLSGLLEGGAIDLVALVGALRNVRAFFTALQAAPRTPNPAAEEALSVEAHLCHCGACRRRRRCTA